MPRFNIERDLAKVVRQGLHKTAKTQRELAAGAGTTTKHVTMVLNGRSHASVQMWQRLIDVAWDGAPPQEESTEPEAEASNA
jgi:hypothetical protein